VPLADGRYSPAALDDFHRLHELEYGHAFRDPIEIVNLRVTAIGDRPRLESLPPASASASEALLGEGESTFRRNGSLSGYSTRYFERARLAPGEIVAGAAVVFQRDTTVLVPPEWTATAEPAGNLILSRTA
jgi:N-methylhydantoinase A/oxoprolinase/acetone carboxylase beta subunit